MRIFSYKKLKMTMDLKEREQLNKRLTFSDIKKKIRMMKWKIFNKTIKMN